MNLSHKIQTVQYAELLLIVLYALVGLVVWRIIIKSLAVVGN